MMTTSTPLLELKSFVLPALNLKPINVTWFSKERVWIQGASGCGKSTLLRALLGLTPYQGVLLYQGKNMKQTTVLRQFRLDTGWVPQDPPEYSESLSAFLDMMNPLWPVPVQMDDWYSAMEKLHLFQRPQSFKNLSGGERRRMFLALALARKCSVLLLDETLSSLDAQTRFLVEQVIEQSSVELVLTIAHDISASFKASYLFELESA